MKVFQNKESELISQLKNSSITIVSHDAGGANVLNAFVEANNLIPTKLITSGPASQIFQSYKTRNNPDKSDLEDVTLASTGWQTDFEIKHINSRRNLRKRVIVFLDHWTNYEQRLMFDSQRVHVPEIVTFDDEAMKLASEVFSQSTIYTFRNDYLFNQSRIIETIKKNLKVTLYDYLFIGEPIRGKGYSEDEAFQYFLSKINLLTSPPLKIAIRPHPSQPRELYLQMASRIMHIPIYVTENNSLSEDLAISKAVVGCNSMALVLANMCQIPVYPAIPEPYKSELPPTSFSSWDSI